MYRLARALVESILFIGLLIGFALWLFGPAVLGSWLIYALVIIIILLEFGGNLIEWFKERILKRLSSGISFENMRPDVSMLEKMFRHEMLLYATILPGLIGGTITGVLRQQSPLATVLTSTQLVLFLAIFCQIYFLVISIRNMSYPLFKTSQVNTPQITAVKSRGWFNRLFEVLVPPPPLKTDDEQEQRDLDLARDVSELRKIYKYDTLHHAILLVVFANVLLSTGGIIIQGSWVTLELIAAAALLSIMPYGIGQYLMHQKILERFTGSKRAEMAKKLTISAPIYSPLPALAAVMTSGTIGSILYILFDQFIQNSVGKLFQ